ncbi:MAG TPA: hypothetical protein VGO92_12965, partial [Acidimicrobiales bacterium]|nr:hypothetical protein [Acidimicrobiales bacterium]
MMHLLLAALQWDPQIRGALIVLTAILILPGSVYLLLATNSGPRLGFLLAVAGLSGWLAIMGIVWMVFGIGLKGREPSWKPKELITGSLQSRVTVDAMSDFPNGWKVLDPSNPKRGDVQSAADRILVPSSAAPAHGEAKPPTPEQVARFGSPFKATVDYVVVNAYEKGGDNYLFKIGRHKFTLRHSTHYAVAQVQPVICTGPPTCATADLKPDPTKPVTTLIMVRDLGSVRFPPFLIALASLLVFAVTCSALHERDKEIMRARG